MVRLAHIHATVPVARVKLDVEHVARKGTQTELGRERGYCFRNKLALGLWTGVLEVPHPLCCLLFDATFCRLDATQYSAQIVVLFLVLFPAELVVHEFVQSFDAEPHLDTQDLAAPGV